MPGFASEYDWKRHQDIYKHKCDKLATRYPHLTREEIKYIVDKKLRYR